MNSHVQVFQSVHSCCFNRVTCNDLGVFSLGAGDLLASHQSDFALNCWGVLMKSEEELYVLWGRENHKRTPKRFHLL